MFKKVDIVIELVELEGRVITYKPNTKNYEFFKRNIQLNNKTDMIIAYNLGARNKNDLLELGIIENGTDYG